MKHGPPILVVEDNLETRRALTAVLAIRGYAVVEATDGSQALDYLRRTNVEISLVLLDLLMPRMDGYQFLEAALADQELKKIPIVVYSAIGPERLPRSIPYVPKGNSSPDQLLDVVQRQCRRA